MLLGYCSGKASKVFIEAELCGRCFGGASRELFELGFVGAVLAKLRRFSGTASRRRKGSPRSLVGAYSASLVGAYSTLLITPFALRASGIPRIAALHPTRQAARGPRVAPPLPRNAVLCGDLLGLGFVGAVRAMLRSIFSKTSWILLRQGFAGIV